MKKCVQLLTVLLFVTLFSGYAFAADVQPGVDLFETPGLGFTEVDLNIPPSFFEPGSDPFVGTVAMRGKSIQQGWEWAFCHFEQLPINSLGPTSTIVERKEVAVLPGPGTYDTVPIEIIALNLVSVEPIEVTYGGIDPEQWKVQVTLSSDYPQNEGTMTIYQEYDDGGTYEAYLPVRPRFTFTRVTDLEQRVLDDPSLEEIMETPINPPMPLPADACWSHSVPFPIVESDGTAEVDHDGNPATPRVAVGPSSNFVAGGCGFDAFGNRPDPINPPVIHQKVHSQEAALNARHGVQPANPLVHFKIYDVVDTMLTEPVMVTLQDQFDTDLDTVDVFAIEYFANPVDKNYEGLADPLSHHNWYRILPLNPDPTLYWVDVENQFIRQRLWLGPAQYLLVPAEKNGEGFPYMLDHYQAYPVISGKILNVSVHLEDQFGIEDVEVRKPIWFCNPVDKNDEGIMNEVDHLVVYDFEPPMPYAELITVADQFITTELEVVESLWLGVPSNKLQWGTWPTAVELGTFEATKYGDRIEVVWTTASEIATGGFNVHRSLDEDGPYARINDGLIPSKGTELEGATYSFADRDVVEGLDYYYQLESVDLSGEGMMHGPVLVTAAEESSIPAAFRLAQNNPNPFNPITEIRYDLPVDCHVNLVVYNVLGQKVATLVDGFQKAGSRVASWDSRADSGMRVASGIYFYKLHAGTFIETRKMVLLR